MADDKCLHQRRRNHTDIWQCLDCYGLFPLEVDSAPLPENCDECETVQAYGMNSCSRHTSPPQQEGAEERLMRIVRKMITGYRDLAEFGILKGNYAKIAREYADEAERALGRDARGGVMSLFQCDKCGVIENTALTFGYVGWTSTDDWPAEMRTEKGLKAGGKYCSECFDGKWHGKFPQKFYPLGTKRTDRFGNIEGE